MDGHEDAPPDGGAMETQQSLSARHSHSASELPAPISPLRTRDFAMRHSLSVSNALELNARLKLELARSAKAALLDATSVDEPPSSTEDEPMQLLQATLKRIQGRRTPRDRPTALPIGARRPKLNYTWGFTRMTNIGRENDRLRERMCSIRDGGEHYSGAGFSHHPTYVQDRVALRKAKGKFREITKAKIEADNAFMASMRHKFAFSSKYGKVPPKNFPNWKNKKVRPKKLEHPSWDVRFTVEDMDLGRTSRREPWETLSNNYEIEREDRQRRLGPMKPVRRLPEYK